MTGGRGGTGRRARFRSSWPQAVGVRVPPPALLESALKQRVYRFIALMPAGPVAVEHGRGNSFENVEHRMCSPAVRRARRSRREGRPSAGERFDWCGSRIPPGKGWRTGRAAHEGLSAGPRTGPARRSLARGHHSRGAYSCSACDTTCRVVPGLAPMPSTGSGTSRCGHLLSRREQATAQRRRRLVQIVQGGCRHDDRRDARIQAHPRVPH
jgi:hypothetical protein